MTIETEQLLAAATAGDPGAIQLLAHKLDAADPAQIAARQVAEEFKTANPDLFSNDLTRRALFIEDRELAQLRPGMPLAERFALAGQQVRAWIEQRQPKPQERPARAPGRRSGTAPSRAGQQADPAWDVSDGAAEEDTQAVIAKMAASRRAGAKPVWHPRFETDTPPSYYVDE